MEGRYSRRGDNKRLESCFKTPGSLFALQHIIFHIDFPLDRCIISVIGISSYKTLGELVQIVSWVFLGALLLSVVLFLYPAHALVNFDMEVVDIEGLNWEAHGIRLAIKQLGPDEQELNVWVKNIQLPEKLGAIRSVNIHCSSARINYTLVQCPRGWIHFDHTQLGPARFPVDFNFELNGKLSITFNKLTFMGGYLAGQIRWRDGRWLVDLEGEDVELKRLYALLRHTLVKASQVKFSDFNFESTGLINFDATVSGDGTSLRAFTLKGKAKSFGFTNASSTQVGEGLIAEVTLDATKVRRGWRLEGSMRLNQGQLYVDPIFLELNEAQSVWLSATAFLWGNGSVLQINKLSFLHPGVVQVSAQGTFNLEPMMQIDTLEVNFSSARFPDVYVTYFQPALIGTTLDDLMTSGEFSGSLEYHRKAKMSLKLHIKDFSMDDARERFGVNGVKATLNWQNNGAPTLSQVRFEGGHLYKIEFGAAQLTLKSRGGDIDLVKSVSIPVLDGQLNVDSFSLRNVGTEALSWSFDAGLSPVSMETFTQAVGWPLMSGKLSGMIPAVSYRAGNLQVGGALLVRVFDGHITINNLQLLDTLGLVPQLNADIELRHLDLDALTRTFSFGKMEGRVSGYVRKLKLVNWQPVHFNALIGTPENDLSRHRISQRAVDNLTSLGGGISGALSSGFLRLFDEFYYDRVGLSCHLSEGICEMDGIAPSEDGGYYLVTGAWLPRIDIIGYNRRVDWNELVARLKRVSLEPEPILK